MTNVYEDNTFSMEDNIEIIAESVQEKYLNAKYVKVGTYGDMGIDYKGEDITDIEILDENKEQIAFFENTKWGWGGEIAVQCEEIVREKEDQQGFLLDITSMKIV